MIKGNCGWKDTYYRNLCCIHPNWVIERYFLVNNCAFYLINTQEIFLKILCNSGNTQRKLISQVARHPDIRILIKYIFQKLIGNLLQSAYSSLKKQFNKNIYQQQWMSLIFFILIWIICLKKHFDFRQFTISTKLLNPSKEDRFIVPSVMNTAAPEFHLRPPVAKSPSSPMGFALLPISRPTIVALLVSRFTVLYTSFSSHTSFNSPYFPFCLAHTDLDPPKILLSMPAQGLWKINWSLCNQLFCFQLINWNWKVNQSIIAINWQLFSTT